MREFILLALLLPPTILCQESTVELVHRLASSPSDHDAILGLSGQYDPRVIDAFKVSFDAVSDPDDKSLVAFNLVDDGIKDGRYFDYLAARAREAIDDDAPNVLAFDASGKAVKGQPSAEFEAWCANHRQAIQTCIEMHLDAYPRAVTTLAVLVDERAVDLLTRGIQSGNLLVATICVGGLGALNRTEALPAIARRMATLPSEAAFGMAAALGEFDNPDAQALMARYVPDPTVRQGFHGLGYKTLLQRRKQRGIVP